GQPRRLRRQDHRGRTGHQPARCLAVSHSPSAPMITRRSAIATLFAAAVRAESRLAPFFDGAHGAAVLVDIAARRPIAIHAPDLAGRLLVPPGSTMKPFAPSTLPD